MKRYRSPKRTSIALWFAFLTIITLFQNRESVAEEAFELVSNQTKQLLGLEVLGVTSDQASRRINERVTELLSEPLSVSSAAQIALYKNVVVQQLYDQLSATALIDEEPQYKAAGTAIGEMGAREIALTLSARDRQALHRQISEAKLRRNAYRAVDRVLSVAADAERAFYRAVAANQIFTLVERLRSSANASALLRQSQVATGAATKVMEAEANIFEAELQIELAAARHNMEIARLELFRVLGLSPSASISLPDALPDLPEIIPTPPVIASVRRPDLMALRWQLSIAEWSQRLGGVETIKKTDASAVADQASNVFWRVQIAFSGYRAAHEAAVVHENTIIPLSESITEQRLLQYNGMLIDVTDLLAAARVGLRREISALDKKRDFFLARTNFQTAVIGGNNSDNSPEVPEQSQSVPESSGDH